MFAYLQLTLYMTPTHSVPLHLVGEWPGMETTPLNTFYSTCGACSGLCAPTKSYSARL